ncbi:hypothetical protein TRIUR3_20937 [Triticum urartu]|uniref:DUF1618 domain-containing protein n=1 Tax=Triticum urartu TaxID=4572 RepID=M8APP5_TRIUA|nr:hypothetical protein TRIUR3_20937 [Triticum urartu]
MDTGAVPDPEEGTVVILDSVMLDRIGRTHCHNGLGAARKAVKGNKTAVQVDMDSGRSFYVSFTLAAPPQGGASYLDLHWPESSAKSVSPFKQPAYPYVRAIDKDLVLFHVCILSQTRHCAFTTHLFVYTAAGPSPSVQQLPLYHDDGRTMPFLGDKSTTGILRRQEGRYIVADLNLYGKENATGNYYMCAELCIFNSNSRSRMWRLSIQDAPKPQDQSNGQFPTLWSTDHVLALDGRFMCWVDYFSGVLLSDFCNMRLSRVLHFVPFPGEEEYTAELTPSVPRRLPEYPIITPNNPDVLYCLLRKQEFHGEASMIMVDMNPASPWLCTPYINRRSVHVKDHKSEFSNMPLLPTVFFKYLESSTVRIGMESLKRLIFRNGGMPWDNDKFATRPSKKLRSATCEDLESGDWC